MHLPALWLKANFLCTYLMNFDVMHWWAATKKTRFIIFFSPFLVVICIYILGGEWLFRYIFKNFLKKLAIYICMYVCMYVVCLDDMIWAFGFGLRWLKSKLFGKFKKCQVFGFNKSTKNFKPLKCLDLKYTLKINRFQIY